MSGRCGSIIIHACISANLIHTCMSLVSAIRIPPALPLMPGEQRMEDVEVLQYMPVSQRVWYIPVCLWSLQSRIPPAWPLMPRRTANRRCGKSPRRRPATQLGTSLTCSLSQQLKFRVEVLLSITSRQRRKEYKYKRVGGGNHGIFRPNLLGGNRVGSWSSELLNVSRNN